MPVARRTHGEAGHLAVDAFLGGAGRARMQALHIAGQRLDFFIAQGFGDIRHQLEVRRALVSGGAGAVFL